MIKFFLLTVFVFSSLPLVFILKIQIALKVKFPKVSANPTGLRKSKKNFVPKTSETKLKKKEIRPLMRQDFRFLQPTKITNIFWAAIPDKETGTTQIGRYDLQKLEFIPVLTIPAIIFYSNDFWMDETENSIYIVYNFQLIKIPLQKDVYSTSGTN